ncbi:MAG: hypothetical protein IJC31_08725 [Spirochaetaceae bacterium]|nr:hypothetical protein [Spirochaetaceae bacterium]
MQRATHLGIKPLGQKTPGRLQLGLVLCTFAKKAWIFLKFLVDIVTRIRFCYAKSVRERQVNSCSNPGKPLGFPKTCDNFFKLPPQAGFVCSERYSWFGGCTFAGNGLIFLQAASQVAGANLSITSIAGLAPGWICSCLTELTVWSGAEAVLAGL